MVTPVASLSEQRQAKFLEHRLKCTKARNEYLLSLASVNAAVSSYYLHDVLDLMDVSWASGIGPQAGLGACAPRPPSLCASCPQCCDMGFHLALGQALRSFVAAESRSQASHMQGLGSLEEALEALDPLGDKAKVLEVHAAAFCPPLRFDYQPHEGDQVRFPLHCCVTPSTVAKGFWCCLGFKSGWVHRCPRPTASCTGGNPLSLLSSVSKFS